MDGKTFLIQSVYDHKTLTAMSHAMRKTLRRGRSIALRIFGWTIVGLMTAFQLLLAVMGAFIFYFDEFIILLVMAVMIALLLEEDHLNAWTASFLLVPGSKDSKTRFEDGEYVCTNDAAVTQYPYENIGTVCEMKGYFVFFLGKRHGQIYPKSGFLEGTPEDFRAFIAEKTGKEIRFVK